MNTDATQDTYNKYQQYPLTGYNIAKYLIENEEQLWKILKYSDSDAWKKDDLSHSDKADLIYAGQPNETFYRLFFDSGQDNAWTEEACFLRIATLVLTPSNYVYGYMSISFELYTHYKIATLSNYTTRLDYGTQRIIECLNGADIPDVGRLYFDSRASSQTRSILMGAIPYKGRATIMCNHILG